jgi:hypothetical protein
MIRLAWKLAKGYRLRPWWHITRAERAAGSSVHCRNRDSVDGPAWLDRIKHLECCVIGRPTEAINNARNRDV